MGLILLGIAACDGHSSILSLVHDSLHEEFGAYVLLKEFMN